MKLAILILCAALPVYGADWYVSNTGTGDGTFGNPGSLTNAVGRFHHFTNVAGGDTILLRGGFGGGYSGAKLVVDGSGFAMPFQLNQRGSSRITIKSYTNEWAIIDGGFKFNAVNVWLTDLELWDSHYGSQPTNASFLSGPWPHFASGQTGTTNGCGLERVVVHDVDNFIENGTFGIVLDSLFYKIGLPTGLGHIFYNSSSNLFGNIALWCGDAALNNFHVGPVGASISNIWASGANACSLGGAANVIVQGNKHYRSVSNINSGITAYILSGNNKAIYWNYIASPNPFTKDSGATGSNFIAFNNVTDMNTNATQGATFTYIRATTAGSWLIDSNRYYNIPGSWIEFRVDEGPRLSFNAWTNTYGFDVNSQTNNSQYPPDEYFVTPAATATNRGTVAVYNWTMKPTVSVVLSNVYPGQIYHVNFLQREIASGTYTGAVTIPMTNLYFPPTVASNWVNVTKPLPFNAQAGATNQFLPLTYSATNPIPTHVVLSGQAVIQGQVVVQ